MTKAQEARPLSPHLTIYKPQISSVLSISHRLTGIALSAGLVVLAAWLWAAAFNAEYFNDYMQLFDHWIGQVLLVGWTFCFYYHLSNGIRHLFWDIGKGFSLPVMTKSGWFVVLLAVGLTAGTWWHVCNALAMGA
ncbi:MAG: succinate dehydrogenase, cytochrome b556 subunit [Rickettsiales bacterium]|nr:succinate dehydrogenase, cytochrome b556 subunit [Rickettsiales bacterium]